MLRRAVLAMALLLVAAPSWGQASPGDPAAFVKSLYREPAPLPDDESSDEGGTEASGEELYAPSLRALLEIDAQRDMNYLDFDWVWGGQDLPDAKDLKIVVVKRTAETAQVRVTFLNYGERRERVIDLVVENGAWVIEDVFLKVPEKAWLSRILTENRQD